MAYEVHFSHKSYKQLAKLDKFTAKKITNFLQEKVCTLDNPRQIGKPLSGTMKGLWRYRVGDYRIICNIRDAELIVLVLTIGNRRQVYQKFIK